MIGLTEVILENWVLFAAIFVFGFLGGWLLNARRSVQPNEEIEIARLKDDLERARQAQAEKDRRLTICDAELAKVTARVEELEATAP